MISSQILRWLYVLSITLGLEQILALKRINLTPAEALMQLRSLGRETWSRIQINFNQNCSLVLGGKDLGLEGVGSGEANGDLVGSDLAVDLCHGLDLGLNLFLVEGVEEDLNVLLAIESNSGWFSSDGGGEDLLNNNFI